MGKEVTSTERFTNVYFKVQRNGITDRVNVGMGETLDVEDAESIEIIETNCIVHE